MIFKSEQIHELAKALSDFQGELQDVYKGSKGYGYDYADLSAVFEAVRPLMKKHGLSVTQPVGGSNNMIELNTVLLHSSGQYISSITSIPVDMTNKKMNSLQAAGSTITYMRRYCLCSILGLATTDDDGKAGGEHIDDNKASHNQRAVPVKMTSTHKVAPVTPIEALSAIGAYTEEQLHELRQELIELIIDKQIPVQMVEKWCAKAGVKSVTEFDINQAIGCIEYIKKQSQKDAEILKEHPTEVEH